MWVDLFPDTLWEQLLFLVVAFVLSAVIGIERQRGLKSAGVRTHTLVGVGSALFTLVSSYGFSVVLGAEVLLDPSRIAAQIVSGIGFLGAGVIFVRRNAVSGLTTAASVWVTAAIGMACGAAMLVQATATAGLYLLTVGVLSRLTRRIPSVENDRQLSVRYEEGHGTMRHILAIATDMGFQAALVGTERHERHGKKTRVEANLTFHAVRRPSGGDLIEAIAATPGVVSVQSRIDDDA